MLSGNTPPSPSAGGQPGRRSRTFNSPVLGMPENSEDRPVLMENRGETHGLPKGQFPWLFPEHYGKDSPSIPNYQGEEDEDALDSTRDGYSKDLRVPESERLVQSEAVTEEMEAGLSYTPSGAAFKMTPSGVAGGIIWSEILQAPRCQRPYRRNRK